MLEALGGETAYKYPEFIIRRVAAQSCVCGGGSSTNSTGSQNGVPRGDPVRVAELEGDPLP